MLELEQRKNIFDTKEKQYEEKKYGQLLIEAISMNRHYEQIDMYLLNQNIIAKRNEFNIHLKDSIISKYLLNEMLNAQKILCSINIKFQYFGIEEVGLYSIIEKIQGYDLRKIRRQYEINHNINNKVKKKHILELYKQELLKIVDANIIPDDFVNLGNAIYNDLEDKITPIDYESWQFRAKNQNVDKVVKDIRNLDSLLIF